MYLVYLAILPVILLLIYVYKKDIDKEPRSLLRKIFIFGCLTFFPILICEVIFSNFYTTDYIQDFGVIFVSTLAGTGLIEEFFKWLVTYICSYNNKEFNHQYDAIVYSVFASLGFALVENILYVVFRGYSTAILRALLSVPSHAVDAIFMGYFMGLAKKNSNKSSKELLYLSLSILIPILSHTIYDALLYYIVYTSTVEVVFIFFPFVLLTYVVCILIINNISKIYTNFDGTRINGIIY